MTYINLTLHAIGLALSSDVIVSIPPSGAVARVESTPEVVGQMPVASPFVGEEGGEEIWLPVSSVSFGDIVGLPAPVAGTVYIVSGLVAARAFGRTDVVAPESGASALRNDKGQIVAVRGFIASAPAPSGAGRLKDLYAAYRGGGIAAEAAETEIFRLLGDMFPDVA